MGAGAVGRGGGGGGGLDISNLMKPALARGELQVIGATTLDEHRKHVERDAALERRSGLWHRTPFLMIFAGIVLPSRTLCLGIGLFS